LPRKPENQGLPEPKPRAVIDRTRRFHDFGSARKCDDFALNAA
jgi:hypothetical protein